MSAVYCHQPKRNSYCVYTPVDFFTPSCPLNLNVSRETIYQWQKDVRFIAIRERTKSEFLTVTVDTAIAASLDGMRLLSDVATDIMFSKLDRVPAAKFLAEVSLRYAEQAAKQAVGDDDEFIPVAGWQDREDTDE